MRIRVVTSRTCVFVGYGAWYCGREAGTQRASNYTAEEHRANRCRSPSKTGRPRSLGPCTYLTHRSHCVALTIFVPLAAALIRIVECQAAVDGLPQQIGQRQLHVLAAPVVHDVLTDERTQAQALI